MQQLSLFETATGAKPVENEQGLPAAVPVLAGEQPATAVASFTESEAITATSQAVPPTFEEALLPPVDAAQQAEAFSGGQPEDINMAPLDSAIPGNGRYDLPSPGGLFLFDEPVAEAAAENDYYLIDTTEETFQEPLIPAGEPLPIFPAAVQQQKSKPAVQQAVPSLKKRGRKSFKEMDAEADLVSIPEDEQLFSKQYYAISEVASWFRVNTSLLRYWENEFDILKPRKNRKGDRLFRPEDVRNLQVIYYLLRQRKFTIDGAKKYLKANRKQADTNLQLIQCLNRFKGFLLELKLNITA